MLELLKALLDRSPVPALTVTQVAERLRAGEVRVFDCDPPRARQRGRVPGAAALDPVAFRPAELPAARGTVLVFYGREDACGGAMLAARRARAMGYTQVHLMPDGLAGWENEGRPVEHRRRPHRPAA